MCMRNEVLAGSSYVGTKNFSQNDVQTANATGFGAATDDYSERGIDLNEQLVMNKPATYFFRMNGDAMNGAGITAGDVLVVDRSLKPAHGSIVVGALEGELLVRYFNQSAEQCWLSAANHQYKDILLGEFDGYRTWGVVTCCIHLIAPALKAFNAVGKRKKP